MLSPSTLGRVSFSSSPREGWYKRSVADTSLSFRFVLEHARKARVSFDSSDALSCLPPIISRNLLEARRHPSWILAIRRL